MGRVCVSLCRCCVLVSVVHPVAILSAVFYVICSLFSLYQMRVVTIWWTYKVVMRPALEYASSIWSSLASSTSIKKLQVMQNAALRTATECTQDTKIQHLHDDTLILPIHKHTAQRVTMQTKNTITSHTQTYNILQHSKAKKHFL